MGAGIAQVLLANGLRVHLIDTRPAALEAARQSIADRFASMHAKGKWAQDPGLTLERLSIGTLDDAPAFQLMIEAIAEILEVKQALFAAAMAHMPDAIFATNTSSLSVNELAASLVQKDRFVGLHFFNPAPLMPLVEVVQADTTPDWLVELCHALCQTWGKAPVIVKDSPGFIVNRVARPFYAESMRTLADGAASFQAIDHALKGQGFKMGPFELMDLIGLDVNYNVTKLVWEGLGKPARFTPNPVQGDRVARGDWGIKTHKGFYDYPKDA